MTETHVWDRLPQETNKSYKAFQTFLLMPVYGEAHEKRTLENLCQKLGYKSMTMMGKWSAKFKWMERAAAYDAYAGTREIVIHEAAIDDYRQAVATSLGAQLVVLNEILDRALNAIRSQMDRETPVDTSDIMRLTNAIEKKDNLARRLGGMPTNYSTETGEELDDETVYVIGGDK